jgi:hypothetical protein
MKNKIQIKSIPYGIASRVGNTIYINEKLRKFNPELYEAVLMHEYAHTEGFSIKDIALDINNKELNGLKLEYYKFIFSNPKTFTELLPIWKYDNKIQINLTLLLFYSLIILLGGLLWMLY